MITQEHEAQTVCERDPRWLRMRTLAMVVAAGALVMGMTACAEEEVPEQLPETVEEEPAREAAPSQMFTCDRLKQRVHAIVNILTPTGDEDEPEIVVPDPEELDGVDPDAYVEDPEDATEAVAASRAGLGGEDQYALNASCELYGQILVARELWDAGDRADSCDVIRPAHQRSEELRQEINPAVLDPLSAHYWAGATGIVAEHHGACVAEARN